MVAPPIQNETLLGMLRENPGLPGSRIIRGYQAAPDEDAEDILLAYHPLTGFGIEGIDLYFTAYRPTHVIFSPINRIAILALVGCILFIAVLCVNAYRDVHNNIVRPLALLNEGAQIARNAAIDAR